MGAGAPPPLQQPLLGPGAVAGAPPPSAPPLPGVPYVPATAPPGPGPYPPYDAQHPGAGAYPPAMPPPLPPAIAPRAYAPPPVVHAHGAAPAPPVVHTHTTHVYEGPLIQRVSLAPVLQMCPSCGSTGPTRVRRERGCCTWLQAFGMCWLFCPLFWLPCCLDCSKDLVHRCSSCGAEVARITPC